MITGVNRTVNYSTRTVCTDCNGSGAAEGGIATCPQCNGSGVETVSMGNQFMHYQTTCRKCSGAGTVIRDPCGTCGGRGSIRSQESVPVDIPAGVEDGMDMRVPGKGQAGTNGGPAGNLYIRIRVTPSSKFERSGADIHSEVPISLAQAVFGGTIIVPGVSGDLRLKVKPGTEAGGVSRISGRGLPRLNSSQKGDHFVHFGISIPKVESLSQVQREALLTFAAVGEEGRTGTVNELDSFLEQQLSGTLNDAAGSNDKDDETSTGCKENGFFSSLFGGDKSNCNDDEKQESPDKNEDTDPADDKR